MRRALALSALAQVSFPSQAQADETRAGAGVHLELAFESGGKLGFGWGIDLFALRIYDSGGICSNEARSAVGPLVQFGMIGLHSPRIVAGAYATAESERDGGALGGELGGTLRFGPGDHFGIHTALVPSIGPLSLFGRAEWLLGEGAVGLGVRYPPFDIGLQCIEGRVLRGADGNAIQRQPLIAQRLGRMPALRCAAPELAAASLASDAQTELESVPAFLQLAVELDELGAPETLVHAALDAAEQELVHAALVASLAERCAPVRVRPRSPLFTPRAPLSGAAGLARLAVESYVDGCLGEGIAAARAREGATTATDPTLRGVRQRIARDESGHAALAWSILRFALGSGASEVAEALAEARSVNFGSSDGLAAGEPDDWSALGKVPRQRGESLAAQQLDLGRARLETLLSART